MNSEALRRFLESQGYTLVSHKADSGHLTARRAERIMQIPVHDDQKELGRALVGKILRLGAQSEVSLSLHFPIEITPDDNGTLLATCPVLSEVNTFGTDREDVMRHAANAVEEALAARVSRWLDIPSPHTGGPASPSEEIETVRISVQSGLKVLLFLACKESGVTRVELAHRLKWRRNQVERLFRFDHASRLEQLEEAFAAIGMGLDRISAVQQLSPIVLDHSSGG